MKPGLITIILLSLTACASSQDGQKPLSPAHTNRYPEYYIDNQPGSGLRNPMVPNPPLQSTTCDDGKTGSSCQEVKK